MSNDSEKLVEMLLSIISWEFVIEWILFRLIAIIVNVRSVKNGGVVDRGKGVGVVTMARIIRRCLRNFTLSLLTSHNIHKQYWSSHKQLTAFKSFTFAFIQRIVPIPLFHPPIFIVGQMQAASFYT